MTLLDWQPGRREDRGELSVFDCTVPARKVRRSGNKFQVVHPKKYELQVQAKVRSFQPPYKPPLHLWIGRDGRGIGSVILFEELDGIAQVELCYGAVHNRLRGKGGGMADEMIQHALDEITYLAIDRGVDRVSLSAQVHEEHARSQDLCRRNGLRHTGMMAEGSPYQQWAMTLSVGQVSDDG